MTLRYIFRSKVESKEIEDDINDILDAIGNVQDPDNVYNNENQRLDDQANVDKDDGIIIHQVPPHGHRIGMTFFIHNSTV